MMDNTIPLGTEIFEAGASDGVQYDKHNNHDSGCLDTNINVDCDDDVKSSGVDWDDLITEGFGEQDPTDLKDLGNEKWKEGNIKAAESYWQEGLKTCLKASCRGITNTELRGVQISLRCNLAALYLSINEYRKAILNSNCVLEQEPDHLKATYRKALAYYYLQDYENATGWLNKVLVLEPSNQTVPKYLDRITHEIVNARMRDKVLFKKMLAGSTSNCDRDSKRAENGRSDHSKEMNHSKDVNSSSEKLCRVTNKDHSVCGRMWKVDWLPDDDDEELWKSPNSLTFLKEVCNVPLTRSLPLTILNALEAIYTQCPDTGAVPLPDLKKTCLCIHVIGATYISDMYSKFTHILRRLQPVESLILVFIGFIDNDGRFPDRLSLGQTSQPMVIEEYGKMQVAVCFRGKYQLFLEKYPEVLSNENHVYHPNVCVLSSPQIHIDTESWTPVVNSLVVHRKLTIITGSSDYKKYSDDAIHMETQLRLFNANIILPVTRNRFPIILECETSMSNPKPTPPSPPLSSKTNFTTSNKEEKTKSNPLDPEILPSVFSGNINTDSPTTNSENHIFAAKNSVICAFWGPMD